MLFSCRLWLLVLLGIFHSTYLFCMETTESRSLMVTFENGSFFDPTCTPYPLDSITVNKVIIKYGEKNKKITVPVIEAVIHVSPNIEGCANTPHEQVNVPKDVMQICIKNLLFHQFSHEHITLDRMIIMGKKGDTSICLKEIDIEKEKI